jgi:transcriptional regulator with XRE-family HTH domain
MNKQQQLMQQIIDRANELGYNYSDVAERCDVNVSTVSRNFKGDTIPSSDTILKYVSGLKLQIVLG